MNKKLRISICLLLSVSFLLPVTSLKAETNFYTYTYDYWSDERESPDAYIPTKVLYGADFGLDNNFKEPQGLYVRDNRIFICDSFNNRIVELEKIKDEYTYVRTIESVTIDGEISMLKYPNDIYMNEDMDLFICDTNNERILHLDYNLSVKNIIEKPEDETLDETFIFYPSKIVVDSAGRIYVQATNVNKGLMEFAPDGDFTGYVGANKVTVNMMDYIWKLISTKEQRSQMELFVPTEYNNLTLDSDGFIYTTTSALSEAAIDEGTSSPIRKLNSMGTDILVRNGYEHPIGDLQYSNSGGIIGPSRLVDITVLENDTYYALDRTRGRIFAYDFQGNLLYAFGGSGNRKGYFSYPTAIEDLEDGKHLLVIDYKTGALTEFTLTEYGKLINDGLMEYKKGNYDISAQRWEEVLKLNGNYDLAYIGIGRSLLRKGDYKEAMKYFKLKRDAANYSKAYKLYRKEVVEDNIGYGLVAIAAIITIPKLIKSIIRVKRKVEEA